MKKPSLKAYLDLIQELLSCPQGEEWILLRQHQGLVNLGLVEVMEQVANHFTAEGKIKAAKYLHNWAAQLHHILMDDISNAYDSNDKTPVYLELIQALLDCPEGLEPEILAAHRDLIDPQLVRIMKQIASQMAEKDRDTADYLNNLAADLNRTWLEHHQFEPTFKQEIAPDPWLDVGEGKPVPTRDSAIAERSPEKPEEHVEPPLEVSAPPPSSAQYSNEALNQLLTNIADSLVKLEAAIVSLQQTANPLWYMEVLEKAAAAQWILTTDEVEQLIGVKPHCHHDETDYHRGSWLFVKAGKIGAQTGWRVRKQDGQ